MYIEDSGLLHSLLKIPTPRDLEARPKLGMSWEGFMFVIHAGQQSYQLVRKVRAVAAREILGKFGRLMGPSISSCMASQYPPPLKGGGGASARAFKTASIVWRTFIGHYCKKSSPGIAPSPGL